MNTSPLARFASKWCHPSYDPAPVSEDDLAALEATFDIRLPTDYKTQVLSVGTPSPTGALLSQICDAENGLNDLSDLIEVDTIPQLTKDSHGGGLPAHLLMIGDDCAGNSFCFSINDLKGAQVAHAPIYFWDHDFDTTTLIAELFSDWIELYLGKWSDGLTYADF